MAIPPRTLHAQARDYDEEPTANYHAEDCGIRNSTYVYFRLDKFRRPEADQVFLSLVGSLVGDVLLQANDDALLLADGELPVLRRARGRVEVSSKSPWRAPEQIALLGLSVEIEVMGDVV